MPIVHHEPTSVYLYYDRDDLLIYAGITSRGVARNREHNGSKEWWPFVARQDVEHFPTRQDALARELELILEFRPPFNKQHNADHAETRAAYLVYRAAASADDATARSLFNALDKRLPLIPLSVDGRSIILRSQPAHAAIACSIAHQPGVKVHGAGRVGRVVRIERRGMFALFHIKADLAGGLIGASGPVKYLDQKSETFALRHVNLEVAA